MSHLREVPGAIPAKPDGVQLTDEEREFRRKHVRAVAALLSVNGELEQYPHWNEEEFRRLWPELWSVWKQRKQAQVRLFAHLRKTLDMLGL